MTAVTESRIAQVVRKSWFGKMVGQPSVTKERKCQMRVVMRQSRKGSERV